MPGCVTGARCPHGLDERSARRRGQCRWAGRMAAMQPSAMKAGLGPLRAACRGLFPPPGGALRGVGIAGHRLCSIPCFRLLLLGLDSNRLLALPPLTSLRQTCTIFRTCTTTTLRAALSFNRACPSRRTCWRWRLGSWRAGGQAQPPPRLGHETRGRRRGSRGTQRVEGVRSEDG